MPDYIRVYDEGAKRHYSAVVGSSDVDTPGVTVTEKTPGDWRPPTDENDEPLDELGNAVKSAKSTPAKPETKKENG